MKEIKKSLTLETIRPASAKDMNLSWALPNHDRIGSEERIKGD